MRSGAVWVLRLGWPRMPGASVWVILPPPSVSGTRSPARASPESPARPSVPGVAVGAGQAHDGAVTVSLAVALGSVASGRPD